MGIALTDTARDLVRSGFFGKDFDSYVSELTDFIQLRFGDEIASNIVASEQGIMLIEMVSFALSTMSWYGDRQADDTNLRDARLRAAAVSIARQLGYKPRAAVPPAVEITMTLAAPAPSRLTLERGRKLNGPSGLSFEMAEEVIFDAGETGPKVFAARQGVTLEEIFTSTGEPSQFFPVTVVPGGSSIAQDSPQAFVDNVEWPEEAFLQFEQVPQFEFQYGFAPPRIQFGDGIAGNIPVRDAEIRVRIFTTDGTGGSVPANTVTTFTQPLVAGGQTLEATLVHDEPSTPGSNREALQSIKINAPQVFQTADRAVTQQDLDALINSFIDATFGAVAIGRATVPRSAEEDAEAQTIIAQITNCGCSQDVIDDLTNYWNKVLASDCQANVIIAQILAADSEGRYVSASVGLARALEVHLDARAESTAKVQVTDGSINLISVDVAAQVRTTTEFSSGDQQEAVLAEVRQVIEGVLLGRSYGISLRISDLYAVVDAVEGVDYAHVQITGDAKALTKVNVHGDVEVGDFEVITLGVAPVVTPIS
jgi:hypothetical protein